MERLIWVLALLTLCTGCANFVHYELADADIEPVKADIPQLQHDRERADHYIALLHKRKQDFEERQAYYEYIHSRSRLDTSEFASNSIPNSVCATLAEGQAGKTAMAGTAFRDYETFRAVSKHCRDQSDHP
jgi:hypothetical protein